ncbi:MAG: GNAT family N-acetyltransferase [Caulobacterales bacterium]|nr:GNAT family N-acetyltransferase [Caulobacterales bacterium]
MMESSATDALVERGEYKIVIARTLEDFARVIALRAAVYMAEQSCPYAEEFDGNDLTGTQLLAYRGDQPVGSLRLRWFSEFLKMERLCVLPQHRVGRASRMLVKAGVALAARKGYRRVLGNAQEGKEKFWRSFGFEARSGRTPFSFSGHLYTEYWGALPDDPQAISIETSPHVLNRPEGAWDRPGVLESQEASLIAQSREAA